MHPDECIFFRIINIQSIYSAYPNYALPVFVNGVNTVIAQRCGIIGIMCIFFYTTGPGVINIQAARKSADPYPAFFVFEQRMYVMIRKALLRGSKGKMFKGFIMGIKIIEPRILRADPEI